MVLITTTHATYLVVFASGTLLGAASVYFFTHTTTTRYKKTKRRSLETIPFEERYQFPELKDEYRLVMAIRNDLRMQKGKVAAQCGHASVAAYRKAYETDRELLQKWLQFGGTKITVKVDSEEEMMMLDQRAKDQGILSCIVRDAGQTQVAPGSRTVIAIGPAPKSVLEQISGHLKLY